jgi:hypothetical protein
VEFTSSYTSGGWSVRQCRLLVAKGEDWASAQFLFDPADIAYVKNHWIYLDHDQRVSGHSVSLWKRSDGTRVYVDALYGAGCAPTQPQRTVQRSRTAEIPLITLWGSVSRKDSSSGKERMRARLDLVNITTISMNCDGSGVASTPRNSVLGSV